MRQKLIPHLRIFRISLLLFLCQVLFSQDSIDSSNQMTQGKSPEEIGFYGFDIR